MAMLPVVGRVCRSRARVATRASPSARLRTPAMVAAMYSPVLWPMTRSGVMPQVAHSWVRAYSTAKRAGWA